MRRDTDDGQLNLCNPTQPTARGLRRLGQRSGRTSAATLLVSFIGLASVSIAACTDKDTTLIVPADGGTGGRAGSGNLGGSAGTANAGGAGAGGLAGAGGMSGGGGMGGSAGVPNDAGTDAAVPEGGVGDAEPPFVVLPVANRTEIVSSICQRLDEVVGCEPAATCEDDILFEFEFIYDGDGSCVDETNAFFGCLVNDTTPPFACNGGDPNIPLYLTNNPDGIPGNGDDVQNNCAAEQIAMERGFDDTSCDTP